MIKYNSPKNEVNRNVLRELGDDNYNNKSTFNCAIYYRVTGIAILKHTISYLSALDLSACCCNKVKEANKNHRLKKIFKLL